MDNMDVLLETFDTITEQRLFVFNSHESRKPLLTEFNLRGEWFIPHSYNSIAGWVVAHFEARIFLSFRKRHEELQWPRNPLTTREVYFDIWKNLSEKEQDDLTRRTIEKIHRFSEFCFVENKNFEESPKRSEKVMSLNEEEKILKTILSLAEIDVLEKNQAKRTVFEGIKQRRKQNTGVVFIKYCISCNLSDCAGLEVFFMNMLFEFLEQIYFEKYFIQNFEESEVLAQKKKKTKKKKAKNGQINGECKVKENELENVFQKAPVKIMENNPKKTILSETDKKSQEKNASSFFFEIFPEKGQKVLIESAEKKVENNLSKKQPENSVTKILAVEISSKVKFPQMSPNVELIDVTLGRTVLTEKVGKLIDENNNKLSDHFKCESELKIPLLAEFMQQVHLENGLKSNQQKKDCFESTEEGVSPKQKSRKGSFSADFSAVGRFASEKPVEANKQLLRKQKLPKERNSGRIGRMETDKRDSFEFEENISVSQKIMPKSIENIKVEVILERPVINLETVSRNSCQYSVNDSKSVSVTDSMASCSESMRKKPEKNPKLRKMVKDTGYSKKQGTGQNGFSGYPIQNNNHKSSTSHQESTSVREMTREVGVPLACPIKNDPKASKPVKLESKPQKLTKGTNLKVKKTEVKPPKINLSKWEEPETNIDLLQIKHGKYADNIQRVNGNNCEQSNFEKRFSLKVNRFAMKDTMDLTPAMQTGQNTYSANPQQKLKTNDEEKKSVNNNMNGEEKNKPKKNIFRFQNQKNIVEYYPMNQFDSMSYLPFASLITQNRHSLNDAKNKDLVNSIYNCVLAHSRSPDFHLNDETMSVKSAVVLNKTLTRVAQKLGGDVRRLVTDLETFNRSLNQPRHIILDRMRDIVRRSFTGDIQVKAYGSFETGMLTPFSDLDLAIAGADICENEKANEMLRLVRNNMMCYNFVIDSTLIENAAVPVLKFEADPSQEYEQFDRTGNSVNVKVDLIVDISDRINPFNTAFRTTDYIKVSRKYYNTFFENALVLKYTMNFNQLSNTYYGKLKRRNKLVCGEFAVHRISGDEFPGKVG